MKQAVQAPVQERDKPVQATDTGLKPWTPRSDGKRALLVSERATVFDRPAPGLAPADPLQAISDPIWSDEGGTRWTPDLVHARLLLTGEVVRRMPGPLRTRYVCTLGRIAMVEGAAPPAKRIAPTPQEITLADWTLERIMARAHRQVLIASAFGFSGDKIAEVMTAKGKRISGRTVRDVYLNERRIMAGHWQSDLVPVDGPSRQRWQEMFAKLPK